MAINSLSASSYGLSGLVSGMDTQQMVEKLLSGTQAKIDQTSQKKAALLIKQTMYRETISKLKTLQNSYLSYTSGTNLLSSSFYNTMTATVKPPANANAAFSATASSSALVGNTTVDYIRQLATAKTYKTEVDATADVSGEFNKTVAERLANQYSGDYSNLVISVGGVGVTIEEAPTVFGGKSQSQVAQIINDAFADRGVRAEAKFVNNKLQIVAENENAVIKVSGYESSTDPSLPMKMFGTGITTLSGQGKLEASINTDLYQPSFEVNLDGRQQTIYLDLAKLKEYVAGDKALGDAGGLLEDINAKLLNAFGSGVKATATGDTMTFESGNPSQKFTITGNSIVMGALGMKTGISNKLNTTMSLRDLNFSQELVGNHHTFSINGVEFSFDSETSLSRVISEINASKAGVKISYIDSEDRFVIQNSETGAGTRDLDIKQTEGNLMSALFGAAGGSTATGYAINMDMTGTKVEDDDVRYGGTYTFNINGTDYKFNVSRYENGPFFTTKSFAEKMNTAFLDNFGLMADGTRRLEFLEEDGVFTIRANDPSMVVKAVKEHADNNVHQLGFETGQATVANKSTITLEEAGIKFDGMASVNINLGPTLGSFYFGGVDAQAMNSMSMKEAAEYLTGKIRDHMGIDPSDTTTGSPKVTFDEKTASFKFTGSPEGAAGHGEAMSISVMNGEDGERLDRLFGQDKLSINQPATVVFEDIKTDDGKNAVLSINGSEIQRSSNTFEHNGITFTLNSTTRKDKTTEDDDITAPVDKNDYEDPSYVTVGRDTQKVVEGITEFLKSYNETMDYLYGLWKADATYKDYPPLTEAQKKDMSDREVELWEEKSKEGMLRNDQNLERIINAMRKAMYTKPDGSSIAIYDLGITTSNSTSDGNLNPKSISDLTAAIERDPEAVAQLFAGEGGLMELLNNAITDATKSSYAGSGYLTAVAGSNALDTTSSISKQISELDDQLTSLESRYWNEYDRYWKQFNTMEQLIQQMNTQSSWLSQMGG